MDLWDELQRSEGMFGGPGRAELEAPPVLHPVPLAFARDASPGESVTARMFSGAFRDFVLTGHVMEGLEIPGAPDDTQGVEARGVCSPALWTHHRDHPEVFARVVQPWPVDRLWVWREATAPTELDDVPDRFDWTRRALDARDKPSPRSPIRAQDAGPLTGRKVTVRSLAGDSPGLWHEQIALGETIDSEEGFVVPCQTLEEHARAEIDGWNRNAVSLFPVHRVWVRA